MGLAWQQGPLSAHPVGRFLVAEPLPERMLFAERLRRRMRVRFNGTWIAESDDVLLLHEPGHYPVAYFPRDSIRDGVLVATARTTQHRELGRTEWFTVETGDVKAERAAWQHADPPKHADEMRDRVAFAWRAMDAFYEEDERIVGHAADPYHRIDIRRSSRHVRVLDGDRVIADSTAAMVLYESGFAPRWYVPRDDVDLTMLTKIATQTFCPYKGIAEYYDIGDRAGAVWGYPEAWPEVARIAGALSFEPDKIDVFVDDEQLRLEPGQSVIAHGLDRGLDIGEILGR
ncbi:DUF427 domain-containing protein [Actinoplanes sp. TBRC 11911]|uniref:DUF427 domain-containing protein n=1 Tax=Actinoplanes sp. TBRC 11911 TaxID=2729386 RepID=UPI00145EFE03|nr:DUF427 domain-containing protein [Actinoplanes sp. TBRC 11911]NMO50110.1 DUF427 domain-containing protein [Actinoplanes sp. TBRC 11911]